MAMILCEECERPISSAAVVCPFCGYPVTVSGPAECVSIKMPSRIDFSAPRFFHEPTVTILGNGINWIGPMGATANLEIDRPRALTIVMGADVRIVETVVSPAGSYILEYGPEGWRLRESEGAEMCIQGE